MRLINFTNCAPIMHRRSSSDSSSATLAPHFLHLPLSFHSRSSFSLSLFPFYSFALLLGTDSPAALLPRDFLPTPLLLSPDPRAREQGKGREGKGDRDRESRWQSLAPIAGCLSCRATLALLPCSLLAPRLLLCIQRLLPCFSRSLSPSLSLPPFLCISCLQFLLLFSRREPLISPFAAESFPF